jgi:hypothetical protein
VLYVARKRIAELTDLLSQWSETYHDGFHPDGDLIDETCKIIDAAIDVEPDRRLTRANDPESKEWWDKVKHAAAKAPKLVTDGEGE